MRDSVGPAIDTSQTYAFSSSPWKILAMLLGCIAFMVASVLMITGVIDGIRLGLRADTVGWIGLGVFGLFGLFILWRLLTMRGPVLTVSPKGLLDIRVAAKIIPWGAVERVGVWESNRQKLLVLGVAPDVESKLELTRMARWTRGANRALGADGLCIGAQGLKLRFDDLDRLVMAYLEHHAPPPPGDTN